MKTFFYFLSFFLLVACGKTVGTKTTTQAPKNTLRHAEHLRDAAQFTDSKGTDIDALSYFLKGKVDWNSKKLLGEVTIQFKLQNHEDAKLLLDSAVNKVTSVTSRQKPLSFRELKKEGLLEINLDTFTLEEKQSPLEVKISYETNSRNDLEDNGFQIVMPRQGDPVRSRVAFSFAEPESASSWMPCHNTPRDRALFGSEFTVLKDETLISNGDLLLNAYYPDRQARIVRYQTKYTLPTYLMAFSVGQFQVQTLYSNSLPVSVVYRAGLRVDANGLLQRLIQFISHFEKLTVKYPFEKYMLVLLPDFVSGGIEHAGITFQSEERSSQSLMASDLSLSAHELAHQWFGDLMTIQTWDDLWIKEGMATLLSEESMRFVDDQNNSGRLFGKNFEVFSGESVIDPALTPDEKYTSGPYDRAAWVYTQLRSHLGEKTFWAMMQKMLTEKAYGVIGTEELLQNYVAPFAGETFTAKMKTALFAKKLPIITSKEDAGEIAVSLEDEENVLLVPLHLKSENQEAKLHSGNSFKFPKGKLLLMNLGDIHPLHSLFAKEGTTKREVKTALVPHSQEEIAYLTQASPEQAANAISYGEGWDITADQFSLLYSKLKSEESKFNAIRLGCELAHKKNNQETSKAWKAVLTNAATQFPVLGMPRSLKEGFTGCGEFLEKSLYKRYWDSISKYPTHSWLTETNLLKYANFPGTTFEVFTTFRPVAVRGASVRAKGIAMSRLNEEFKAKKEEAGIQKGEWLSFFREVLMTSELAELLTQAVDAVVSSKDKESIPALKRVIEFPQGTKARAGALCGAYTMLKSEPSEWESFKNSLSSELPGSLKSLLESPEKCEDSEDNL